MTTSRCRFATAIPATAVDRPARRDGWTAALFREGRGRTGREPEFRVWVGVAGRVTAAPVGLERDIAGADEEDALLDDDAPLTVDCPLDVDGLLDVDP